MEQDYSAARTFEINGMRACDQSGRSMHERLANTGSRNPFQANFRILWLVRCAHDAGLLHWPGTQAVSLSPTPAQAAVGRCTMFCKKVRCVCSKQISTWRCVTFSHAVEKA